MKRFLWELYLFFVMGYMVTEYMYNGAMLKPEAIQMGDYLSKGTGYKIPPSFKLAGFTFVGWWVVGMIRIANRKTE